MRAVQVRVYQVQAQLSGTTVDGWESSRQAPTMIIGAQDKGSAVRMVSDMAWLMTSGAHYPRHTHATVVEIDQATGEPADGAPVTWARVSYWWGGIETTQGRSYAEIKFDGEGTTR